MKRTGRETGQENKLLYKRKFSQCIIFLRVEKEAERSEVHLGITKTPANLLGHTHIPAITVLDNNI